MTDYSKIVIYKIQHEEIESLIYVGSTGNFTRRKCQHKSRCNNPNGKEYKKKLYEMIRNNGGWECFKMIQIKEFPCNNRREAQAEEDKVMLELKSTMNDYRASRSIKQYYLDNREKFLDDQKKYYYEHREKCLENQKKYNLEHQTQYNLEYIKRFRLKTILCECGCEIKTYNMSNHKKTQKHISIVDAYNRGKEDKPL